MIPSWCMFKILKINWAGWVTLCRIFPISTINTYCEWGCIIPCDIILGCKWSFHRAILGFFFFNSGKMEAWLNSSDVSKFLLIFFFFTALILLWKGKNLKVNKSITFFLQQLILITENNKRSVAHSLWKDLLQIFLLKKRKQTI